MSPSAGTSLTHQHLPHFDCHSVQAGSSDHKLHYKIDMPDAADCTGHSEPLKGATQCNGMLVTAKTCYSMCKTSTGNVLCELLDYLEKSENLPKSSKSS